MKKYNPLIEKYTSKGVRIDNIEYAIDSVKEGAKREHILESLTADYRGMHVNDATNLLEELFTVNGGEFKKENKGGYLYGTFLLMLGLIFIFYIVYVFTYGGVILRPIIVFGCAILLPATGIILLIKAMRGKYRDSEEPFKD